MRRERIMTYEVRGSLISTFPVDMLRHDCAWPSSQADVEKMCDSMSREACRDRRARGEKEIRVRLSSIQEPTVGRWESFGWLVGEVR